LALIVIQIQRQTALAAIEVTERQTGVGLLEVALKGSL
jgi:hypothetical protein